MERDFGELRRTKRKPQKDRQHSQGESYRVCQGLLPSLIFGNEDIEPKNCIGWSNQVKYMKLKYTVLNRMWQHYFMMKQIFFSSIFSSENTGRLAKQAGYPGHDL